MADITNISVGGTSYSIKDAGAVRDISGKADKASITAGTAGTSSATSGSTLAVPYVTMNAQGIVTGYGTHTHTISGFASTSSPSFSGTPTAPTASSSTKNTQIATTAFVHSLIDGLGSVLTAGTTYSTNITLSLKYSKSSTDSESDVFAQLVSAQSGTVNIVVSTTGSTNSLANNNVALNLNGINYSCRLSKETPSVTLSVSIAKDVVYDIKLTGRTGSTTSTSITVTSLAVKWDGGNAGSVGLNKL